MPTKKTVGAFFVISMLTTLLSATVMFIAPLPARSLRLNFGRAAYWIFTIGSSLLLARVSLPWAFSQFILLLAIGLFTDLEQMKLSIFYSAISSVFISAVAFIFMITVWARTQGVVLSTLLTEKINEALTLTQKMQSPEYPVTSQQVLSLFPAIVAISLMLMIFVSLMFVKPGQRVEKLSAFKVPEYVVWFFIGALAGTFLIDANKLFYLQKTFCNALYILSALYYFQGLAVIGFFLKRLKVNYFLKAALFFVFCLHLFIFVAAFGLSDVWFSYRYKLNRKTVKNNP